MLQNSENNSKIIQILVNFRLMKYIRISTKLYEKESEMFTCILNF